MEEIGKLEQAVELSRAGQVDEAIKILRAELKEDPENIDALDALWNMAIAQRTPEAAANEVLGGIRRAARSGDSDLVTRYWIELMRTMPDMEPDPTLAARVVEILIQGGLEDEAIQTLDKTLPMVSLATPAAMIVRLARAAATLRAPSAAALIESAVENPETPLGVREELQELAADVPEPEPEVSEAIEPEPDMAPEVEPVAAADVPKHRLKLMNAVPSRLTETSLLIKVGDKDRSLLFEQIKAVAVAGVKGEAGTRPYLLVDLLLDPPWDEGEDLRAVRILSTAFDPRPMFGGNDIMEGYKKFLSELLMVCHAVPLPDPDTARGRPFRAFASVREYEQKILHVG